MSNFKELELDSRILMGVDAAGFAEPSPIQERTIGPLLAGLDVIGQAKTGTGKTAAYGLPMLQTIDIRNYRVQALILSPTRELAVQITAEIKKLGRYTGVEVLTVYGGQSIQPQFEALRRGVHVVVGTPGRVIDHIKRRTLDLRSVRFVVLDEADTMLDMGFIDDVEFILDTMPGKRQMSLFSATMPQRIIALSAKYMRQPERILVDSDEPSVDTLEQYYAVVKDDVKLPVLLSILTRESSSRAMVFCRTKYGAHRLARELERHHLNAVSLHGDLSQSQRDHSMRLFRCGDADILVATDVASRGIDVPHVGCVVNYEVPPNPELYFHRVGRTARAGNSGISYTLVAHKELGDFARIRGFTKAVIKPLRPEDEAAASYTQRNERDKARSYKRFGSRRNYGRSMRRRYR